VLSDNGRTPETAGPPERRSENKEEVGNLQL